MDGWKDDGLRSELEGQKESWIKGWKGWKNRWKEAGSNISKHIEKTLDFNKHNFLMKYSSQIIHCSYNNKTELEIKSSKENG